MQIKEAGFWSRGTITLPPSPHITPDTLVQELQQSWGPRGFEVYKSALIGIDLVLKKSAATGLGIKIIHSPQSTIIRFNPFAPSVFVRLISMGLIPILIIYYNSWKPLIGEFCAYVPQSPFFHGQMGGMGHPQQMGMGQPQGYPQQGYAPQQGYPQQPGYPPQPGPGYPPQGGGQWQ
jgi:hypothetical protein